MQLSPHPLFAFVVAQSRVLTWGIIGAMSMRAVMIVVGVAAIQRFR